MTEPHTAASKAALEWIAAVEPVDDPAGNTIYDEMRLNFLPRIEAEAADHPPYPTPDEFAGMTHEQFVAFLDRIGARRFTEAGE